MHEAMGRTMSLFGAVLIGMAVTVLLEKVQILPMTCQVDSELYTTMGGR